MNPLLETKILPITPPGAIVDNASLTCAEVDSLEFDWVDFFIYLGATDVAMAALKLQDERPVFEIPTSTGKLRRYQRVGVLQFTLQGQPMTLGAFVPEGEAIAQLFVPFADLTTGKDTYAAGRYLDLFPTQTGLYTIDFNLAYNPYCAYNETYDCPFPPSSNRLKVEVRAGERAPGAPIDGKPGA